MKKINQTVFAFVLVLLFSCSSDSGSSTGTVTEQPLFDYEKAPFAKLSDYNLFTGNLANLTPVSTVQPYNLTSILFTDYAEKSRFIYIPPGKKISYDGDYNVLDFPEGTTLVKNFFYYIDARTPALGKRLIETRLLIKKSTGWKAIGYTWNAEQTEATRNAAGGETAVNTILKDGRTLSVPRYQIPDETQCVVCHQNKSVFLPIGPKPASLNRNMTYSDGSSMNQLEKWKSLGWIDNLPTNVAKIPDYNDASVDLYSRGRAYLDINCGHCHKLGGDASANGVYWNYDNQDRSRLGINKKPSNFSTLPEYPYDISVGDAAHSILIYRMLPELADGDPNFGSTVMPRIARTVQDKEGIKIMTDWINFALQE